MKVLNKTEQLLIRAVKSDNMHDRIYKIIERFYLPVPTEEEHWTRVVALYLEILNKVSLNDHSSLVETLINLPDESTRLMRIMESYYYCVGLIAKTRIKHFESYGLTQSTYSRNMYGTNQ